MCFLNFLSPSDLIVDPGFLCRGQPLECVEYIHNDFLPSLEQAMSGMTYAQRVALVSKSLEAGEQGVPEELKAFGKECAYFLHYVYLYSL